MFKNLVNRIYRSRYYPFVLTSAYLVLFGILVYIIDYFSKDEITEILKRWVPWNLSVNFFFLLTGIIVNLRHIKEAVREICNKKGLFLLLIVLLGFVMASFVVPRAHRIFYDEDIYANVGQNIALTGQAGSSNYGTFEYGEYHPHWVSYNKEPSGWPFLLSLVFKVFGTDELYAFLLNNILFSGGILVVFFITWLLSGAYFASFLSALIFALTPHNLLWANTASAEISASLMTGVTVLALVAFLKRNSGRHLLLLTLLIPFACQMRPESMLVLFWAIIALVVISPKILIDRKTWTFGLCTTILLLPHFLHFYAVGGHSWGAEGSKFALSYFWDNIYTNGIYYLDNAGFPVLFTLLLLVGLLFSRQEFRWRLLIFFWFLLFWGVFLFFYAGSYKYGADVRFALLSFMPLCVLAGMGGGFLQEKIQNICAGKNNERLERWKGSFVAHSISGVVIFLIIYVFVEFLPMVRQEGREAWGARYDHKHAIAFVEKIPQRSIVLTQNPAMFVLWGRNAIQTYAGVNNPQLIEDLMERYQGHVYFHYNYWCNTQDKKNIRLCREIGEMYRLEEVASATERDYRYALYRMSLK